jgi:hypothetical protein
MRIKGLATAFGLLVLSAGVAEAGSITTFTSRSAFGAALGPTTTDTFGDTFGFPISTGVLDAATSLVPANGGPIPRGTVQPGVTYSTPIGSGNFFNIDANSGFTGGFLDGGLGGTGRNPLTVRFDRPVLGFGFDTNPLMGTTFRVSILFQSGARFTSVSPISDAGPTVFFGFMSSMADIVSVQILGRGGSFDFAVDNFAVARAPAVPEPSAMGLLALVVLALALRDRFWRGERAS